MSCQERNAALVDGPLLVASCNLRTRAVISHGGVVYELVYRQRSPLSQKHPAGLAKLEGSGTTLAERLLTP